MTCQTVIAVIDNDLRVLAAIARLLRAHGFRTKAFSSAEAFLAQRSKEEPACLVVDINLGGMSGIELLHRLTAEGSSLPVVVITAVDDAATRRNAIEAGCLAYLQKPSSAELLLAAIGKAIQPAR